MKKKAFGLMLLAVCIFLVFSCQFAAENKRNKKTGIDFTHEIRNSNKGSRSEIRHGYLKFGNYLLPDVFRRVVIDGRTFVFLTRTQLWGKDGYFPDKSLQITLSSNEIDADTLSDGFYLGSDRLCGTPGNWIYVEWDDGSAHTAPHKIRSLVETYRLKTIKRQKHLVRK